MKAWVKGSTWVSIFDVDESLDAGALSRKITGFMMGTGKQVLFNILTKTFLVEYSYKMSIFSDI